MIAVIHLFYEWFKNRSWITWFTQWYECNWRVLFEKVAEGNTEQAKKLIRLAFVIYGSVELFTGALIIKFIGDNHSSLILFPACVFTFGILAFLAQDLFTQNNEWLNRSLKKILGWSFWTVLVFAFPYLVEDEYYQKNPLPFDLNVWTAINIWIGGLFSVVILILLIGKLLNWLHFRFSNLLTKGFQKFAQHCIDKNKEMPLTVFVTEVSVATLVITFLSVTIQKIL